MITISKEKKKTMHIASCSFGKDSLATILLALEHPIRVDIQRVDENTRRITIEGVTL